MQNASRFSTIALLIGEPSRAAMLWKLLDSATLSATDLAIAADISAPNASMHLAKLVQAGILTVVKRGRIHYYRFANPDVPYAIEAIANLVPSENLISPEISGSGRIKYCRTCYDHLAGKVGVGIAEKLLSNRIIESKKDDFVIPDKGIKWFRDLDISVPELRHHKRSLARKCIDWTEKRPHVGGALGAALANKFFELKWIQRTKHSRIVTITPLGQKKINELLGLIV